MALKAWMVEQYLDRLRKWFEDLSGIDRKALRKGDISEADRKLLLSKGKVKDRVRSGLLRMMSSRRQKGLGTFDVDNHILMNPIAFNRLYSELRVDVGQASATAPGQVYLPRMESWSIKGRALRMEVVRYPKGHKWGGRIIKAYKIKE